MKPFFILCSLMASTSTAFAVISIEQNTLPASHTDDYHFDPELFRGSRFNQASLAHLTKMNTLVPGKYKLDIYINNHFSESKEINFIALADNTIQPCFSLETLESLGVKITPDHITSAKNNDDCLLITQLAKGSTTSINVSQLRLDLSVPHVAMSNLPRGYVHPQALDSGSSLGFINYITNYYHVSYESHRINNNDSAWVSLSGGINLGEWQYRQLSTLNWDKFNGKSWNNIRSYLQRPLPVIGSQLSMGELITNGRFFSGLNYNGFSLSTDDRMLPDSLRGYAPTIRGIAVTNAKVTVRQNNAEIYQTTVSPGAFEISDLYPTSYSGDLEVSIMEADGTVNRFTVPFSAVPQSMRPGSSRYIVEVGKTLDTGDEAYFSDFTWQHGLTNSITANSGLRVSDGYQSAMLGGVYGNYAGAFGADLTYSRASLPDAGYTDGWMAHLSWSKTFQPTSTTVSLAGYRYSTKGYRDLNDVLGLRRVTRYGVAQSWQSSTYRQLSRFDISISQSLEQYGSLYLSGSTQRYRAGREHDTQLQFGYGNTFARGISMNLALGKQRNGGNSESMGKMQTMASVSFSIPLGAGPKAVGLTSSLVHSRDGGDQYQNSLSGMVDDALTTSYNLNIINDRHNRQTTVGGSLQKRTSNLALGLNASRGSGYWQASGNVQGAVVAHSGGITPGAYLSDTFALVEAHGATGAKVFSSQQIAINDSGYAVIPALTPYRYNKITLDPQGMAGNAELIDSQKQIAPLAGAGVKVVFRTRSGTALLINSHRTNGDPVPSGASVFNEEGDVIGMVGQSGQLYVRTEKPKGTLTIQWGESAQERCQIPYAISNEDSKKIMLKLTATCTSLSKDIL